MLDSVVVAAASDCNEVATGLLFIDGGAKPVTDEHAAPKRMALRRIDFMVNSVGRR